MWDICEVVGKNKKTLINLIDYIFNRWGELEKCVNYRGFQIFSLNIWEGF